MNDQQPTTQTAARLVRIEDKVDRLAESLITIARVEERITTMLANQNEINKRLGKHSGRLDCVERNQAKTMTVGRVFERVFWIAFTIGASVFFHGAGQSVG